jgi:hypothetical protein
MISEMLETDDGPLEDFYVADATPSTRQLEEVITQVNIHSRPIVDLRPAKSQEDVSLESVMRALKKYGYEYLGVLYNSNRNKVYLVEGPESRERKAVKWFSSEAIFSKKKKLKSFCSDMADIRISCLPIHLLMNASS